MFHLRQSLSVTNESEEHLQYLHCNMNFHVYADAPIAQLIYLTIVISHSISSSWPVQLFCKKIF